VTDTIIVDLQDPVRPLGRLAHQCVGSGHAYLALREDYREHFRRVQQTIGFRRIRFHGILHDLVGIYNEDADGKRTITEGEIQSHTRCAYEGDYQGCGCEDEQIKRYCDPNCRLYTAQTSPPETS
jgi:hypothetical protein